MKAKLTSVVLVILLYALLAARAPGSFAFVEYTPRQRSDH